MLKLFPRLLTTMTIVAASIHLSSQTHASTYLIGGLAYGPSGSSETLESPFRNPFGVVSANSYSNFVEVVVSGLGNSRFQQINDAFYFDNGTFSADLYYQLTLSQTPVFPFTTSFIAMNSIVFDVDANSAVTAPYRPAYRSDHTYHLVLAVGASAAQLFTGVADGDYTDNGGSYSLTLMQLEPVPLPAALPLFAAGLGVLGFMGWRKRKIAALRAA